MIGDQQVVVVHRESGGPVESSFFGTEFAPLFDEVSVGGHHGNAIEVIVADDDSLLAVHGDGVGPGELTVLGSPSAEDAEVVLIEVHYGDPNPSFVTIRGTIEHVKAVILICDDVDGIVEATTEHGSDSDGAVV